MVLPLKGRFIFNHFIWGQALCAPSSLMCETLSVAAAITQSVFNAAAVILRFKIRCSIKYSEVLSNIKLVSVFLSILKCSLDDWCSI